MKLIFGRHADAVNQDGVFHGVTNAPLSSEGQDEAQDLAEKMAPYNPSIIYSSPVKRALDTAKIIGESLNIPVRVAPELSPLDMGQFVGKDIDENLDQVKYYLSNPSETMPGAKESTESWANKFIQFTDKFLKNKSPQAIAILTHGKNILLEGSHIKTGIGFNPQDLSNADRSTEHGGLAIADGKNFQILDQKPIQAGQS